MAGSPHDYSDLHTRSLSRHPKWNRRSTEGRWDGQRQYLWHSSPDACDEEIHVVTEESTCITPGCYRDGITGPILVESLIEHAMGVELEYVAQSTGAPG